MATYESAVEDTGFSRGERRKSGEPSPQFHDHPGLLLGWFVNISQDPKGFGMEIRSGKFFIGRQALRDDDMVIADSALSTPHCLVFASRSEGLRIQDLMSEQGTFLKRGGSSSYTRVQDTVEVEHGDWLRFGAYEVLVCLVP